MSDARLQKRPECFAGTPAADRRPPRPLPIFRPAIILALSALCLACGPGLAGAVQRREVPSRGLVEPVPYEIYLPPGRGEVRDLPYLLFLPGYKDDHTYCRAKGFFAITERMIVSGEIPPLGIVCVGRGRGIWIDFYAEGMKYESALIQDLMPRVEMDHGLASSAGKRASLGISVGGYAVLKISLRHPALFASVSALSPALDSTFADKVRSGMLPWEIGDEQARLRILGPSLDTLRLLGEDPFTLVMAAEPTEQPAYFLTCGREDRHGLALPLVELHRLMIQQGLTVEASLADGSHNASFWREVFPEALRFHARYLGGEP